MNKPIIILSTGRTGTKFFSFFFKDHVSGVTSYHTTKYTRLLNIVSNLYSLHKINEKTAEFIWKILKYKFIVSHKEQYIECNPYYYGLTGIISKYFPETKYLCIVRSPKSYITSCINKEREKIKSKIANHLIFYWQPVSYPDHLRGLKDDFYQRVGFYAKTWAHKNKILDDLCGGNKNALMLKFEDIFNSDSGVAELKKIIEWLNLEIESKLEESILSDKVNKTQGSKAVIWDSKCSEIVNKYCKNLMLKFNYQE